MKEPPDKRQELERLGINNVARLYWNPSTPLLYEEIISRQEGRISHLGPIVVRTGEHSDRSPRDYYIVKESSSDNKVWWGGANQEMSEGQFIGLFYRLQSYLQNKDIFIQDAYLGAASAYQIPVRIISDTAWHNLLARNLFIQMVILDEYKTHVPAFTVIHVPRFSAEPEVDGTNSGTFVIVHPGKNLVIIGGTSYGGELRKAVFTMLTYLMEQKSVLPMHCAVNISKQESPALFLGAFNSGKTTLATDGERILVGDDTHGWSEAGVFNFEGGCYARVIRISVDEEPEIYECTRKFGTILENVGMNYETRRVDLEDDSLTDNTRAAYPNSHIPGAMRLGVCGHPRHILLLACDTFGVLPAAARLTPQQAAYHVLSGYRGTVSASKSGLIVPQAIFETGYGVPFLTVSPPAYVTLLMEKIKKHSVSCWLVNTGWSGKAFGEGERLPIHFSRTIIRNILTGALDQGDFVLDPFFGFQVPQTCDGVPQKLFSPRTAAPDQALHESRAKTLVEEFRRNFQQFQSQVAEELVASQV